jgi:dienelactone hydrolase
LPTLVFYPAAPWTSAGSDTPADGRFPLVVFSHGLKGSPERYESALTGWAAAGFVVVAPTFPHTNQFTSDFRRSDIVRQPADVRFVIDRIRRLDATPGDPLASHIDTTRIAAIGHSAGGYTTSGLFTAGHDPSLKAGVIMAGWLAPGAFAGPPAAMLFLQGTADPIVPATLSRRAFNRVPWAKSYLLLRHNSHATYLQPGQLGYNLMESTVINFLRWTLDGDAAAKARLPRGTAAR